MVAMRDKPCEKCGWKLVGFHICAIDLRTKEGIKAATTPNYGPLAKRTERDEEIVRLYDEELLSMNETARRLGLDFRTVRSVLRRAAAANKIEIRVDLGGRPRRVDA